jgi:hypothetical protein
MLNAGKKLKEKIHTKTTQEKYIGGRGSGLPNPV